MKYPQSFFLIAGLALIWGGLQISVTSYMTNKRLAEEMGKRYRLRQALIDNRTGLNLAFLGLLYALLYSHVLSSENLSLTIGLMLIALSVFLAVFGRGKKTYQLRREFEEMRYQSTAKLDRHVLETFHQKDVEG